MAIDLLKGYTYANAGWSEGTQFRLGINKKTDTLNSWTARAQ
jgi:hypothetical protein